MQLRKYPLIRRWSVIQDLAGKRREVGTKVYCFECQEKIERPSLFFLQRKRVSKMPINAVEEKSRDQGRRTEIVRIKLIVAEKLTGTLKLL